MNLEETFESSYKRVIGQGVGITERGQFFFSRFYEIFFSASEKIPEKFKNTDMSTQIHMLQKGMYQLITFYLTKADSDQLLAIAKSHDKENFNIEPELYDLWLASLLQTVKELDPEYHAELGLAWEIVMTPGILYLKYHYDN
ncbi:MAG: hemoglobin-like flavoprotein [Candidatus Azotimanducaceae bacterium]|jgi:hemoglobin-like flavoprotein